VHVICLVVYQLLYMANGELISVRKHNYYCMLDDGIY